MIGGEDGAELQRRIGTAVGSATVLALLLYPLLMADPTHANRLEPAPYLLIVGAGSVAALILMAPPMRRALLLHHRARAAHVGTAILVATVVGAIAFSGGSYSELHHLLTLPLVFAAMAYPRRVLLGLLGLTIALVAAAHLVTASPFLPARMVARVATVGGSVLITSWLTGAHARQLGRARRVRDQADHQAKALQALARSAGNVNDLDHGAVLDAVVSTAVRIGYAGAGFLVPRHGGIVVAEHAGTLTAERIQALIPEEELRACLDDGTAQAFTVDGLRLWCVPVHIDHRTVGALVGGAPADDTDPEGVGLRILGAQAATALTNADRFRSTHELVERFREVERLRHDLVSTASHELRTPVTVVKAAAELLDAHWDDLSDAQRRQFIGRITAHAGALEHVLDQLARFVDLDTGATLDLDPVPLDLAEVVAAGVNRYRHILADHDVLMRATSVEVVADADALGRAIAVVLDNVATHTPSGTTVRITTDEACNGARLVVADDGPGVPDDVLPTLLSPFVRSGDVLTREARGVGLGLTFADHIVRAHGGNVELSTDGGFTVAITLPTPTPAAAGPPTLAAQPLRPLVLVVEDDASLRHLAGVTLEDAGCLVQATGDGRRALQLAADRPPDVVVLDVDLPGLDGREVARALRDDPATADVPIVVVTGSADRRDLWTIWASGADALLMKPYDIEELARTVLDVAGAGAGNRPGAADHVGEDPSDGRRALGGTPA